MLVSFTLYVAETRRADTTYVSHAVQAEEGTTWRAVLDAHITDGHEHLLYNNVRQLILDDIVLPERAGCELRTIKLGSLSNKAM